MPSEPSRRLADLPYAYAVGPIRSNSVGRLQPGSQNVTYIASRYYRAPECILDYPYYGTR